LVLDTAQQLDTLTVALLEPVNLSNARFPANDSERLFFRNVSQGLIRLDCEEAAWPDLARSWTVDSARRGWILELANGARSSFRFTDTASTKSLGIDSVFGLDGRRVHLLMRAMIRDSVPRFLADPALAFFDSLPSSEDGGNVGVFRRPGLPAIEFQFLRGRDPRDALDREVDLVVSRDPTLMEYISGRPEFTTFALPWTRTYLLLEIGDRLGQSADTLSSPAVRSSLASDVVQASARPSVPPYWWNDRLSCGTTPTGLTGPQSDRVVYRKDDEVARGLAERIVAVGPAGMTLRATGLDPAAFEAALRLGSENAYVISVPRQSLAPCRDASKLPLEGRILPLIDTRAHAVVRKGSPPLTVEWDGTLRVEEP
jgi:hypothetical protein